MASPLILNLTLGFGLKSSLLLLLRTPKINNTLFCSQSPLPFSSYPILQSLPQQHQTPSFFSASRSSIMATSSTNSTISQQPENEKKITSPYGTWKSPITADVVSGAEKRLGGTAFAGNGSIVWLESRPLESGRAVLVMESEKEGDPPLDLTPPEFSVRTLAQEYGGGAFCVSGDLVVFSNYKDQRLYKMKIGDGHPVPFTPDYGGPLVRYADGIVDSHFHRYITIQEDHRQSSLNPITSIVAFDLNSRDIGDPKMLVSGNDFYAFPRLDFMGTKMAWIEWSHPNMPWDKSELWVGYIDNDGNLCKRVCVAGSDKTTVESASEPKWSSQGELFFVTDRRTGFWNLHKWTEPDNKVEVLYELDAEFTKPLWIFGINSYDLVGTAGKQLIACNYRKKGRSYFGIIDCRTGSCSLIDIPFTDINNLIIRGSCICIEGASSTLPLSIAKVDLDDSYSKAIAFSTVWSSFKMSEDLESFISVPEIIEFPTEVPGENAYAYFYPPTNNLYQAAEGEKPPLLLKSHGGPTAEDRGVLDLSIQYWTSRGWAFADVNYGGSTGYGREYRERLTGRWGVVDVNDCCSCATYLVNSGKVDAERLCVFGRSAGGYTTLAALAAKETFKAGASLYGVADLSLLLAETHKFESHYIRTLVGDDKAFYEKSPINNVDKITCPIILFQGLDDKVVPPNQAREIYEALKKKGLPVSLVEYEGEQHGFRKAENIKFTIEQQMVFFARLVGKFQVADDIKPIHIDNLD